MWIKQLRRRYAASTVAGIVTVFSMMLDDAVDERLIAVNPVRRRARRGRRREQHPAPVERVWASPEQVVWIADQTGLLGTHSDWLLVVTTGWTGARWGEMTGLHPGQHPPRRWLHRDRPRDRVPARGAAPSVRVTAAVGVVPMAAAAIALVVFGPETRRKQLERITAEELGRRPTVAAAD